MDAPTSQQAGLSEECRLSLKEWDKWFENSSDSGADSDHNFSYTDHLHRLHMYTADSSVLLMSSVHYIIVYTIDFTVLLSHIRYLSLLYMHFSCMYLLYMQHFIQYQYYLFS